MERAYDDAKYGEYSKRPYIDMVIPSLTDPSVAPPGKHVMSCFVQYAPYHLASGNWDEKKEAFGDMVVNTLTEYAPNFKDIVLGRQVVTPLDLEREWGLTEGNIFQGSFHWSSCSSSGQYLDGRTTVPRSRTFICAEAPRTPAAALWALPDVSPLPKS